jgi:hypothetical protein
MNNYFDFNLILKPTRICSFLKQQKYLALFSSNGAEELTVGKMATILYLDWIK